MKVILSTLGVKMNKSSKHNTWTTVTIVTLLLIAIGAHAGSREFRDRGIKSRYGRGFVEKSFTVSGPFVGTLDGRIRVGNERVYIAPGTPIYVRDEGVQEAGYFVNDATVFIAYRLHKGSAQATYVVVQSERSYRSDSRESKNDREFLQKSDSNSRTGVYTENVPG